jgi:hypothetical protein
MQLAIPESAHRGLRSLRAQAAMFERFRGFDRCMRRFGASDADPAPFQAVAELYAHWGDPLPQTAETYVRSCLTHAARTSGPVVQCGASVLSLALGATCDAAEDRAKQLWCLEADPHWANTMRSWLTQYRIGAAHVIASRPHMFDGYVWYAVDTNRLPADIGLVLCEGARATPSGVIGALQRLGGRLASDFTVLARRVNRAEDLKHLHLWAKSQDAACVVVDREAGFIKITRQRVGDHSER